MATDLASIRTLLIDMDGVLYRGKTGLPGGPELMRFLKERGIKFLMVTNNSTATQDEFVKRMAGFGIDVKEDEIITSGVATAEYLTTIAPAGAKVNVVGEPALSHEMEKRGFTLAGKDADYVVCGWDKTITYQKLATACLAIRAGATFIGTNADKTYPIEEGLIPGAGSILASLIAATDTQPLVIGKPEPIIFEQSMRLMNSKPEETAILGDRLDTDILGGNRAGLTSIMVLTGVNSAEEAVAYESAPDYVFADLAELLDAWRKATSCSTR